MRTWLPARVQVLGKSIRSESHRHYPYERHQQGGKSQLVMSLGAGRRKVETNDQTKFAV